MAATSLPTNELLALLDTLLEAERAGAKVLRVFLADHPEGSEARLTLHKVQIDEAHNCAILARLVRSLGAEPSKATGSFAEKALALQGSEERLAFLNRGQAWVARKIREALPRLPPGEIAAALAEMERSHEVNIAACEALLNRRPPPA